MAQALLEVLGADLSGADALVMAAAVADFRPATASGTKIKKKDDDAGLTLALTKNPDLISEIGSRRSGRHPVLVAFALETGDDATVLAYAKQKLLAKKVDLIVANAAHESLGRFDNRVSIVDAASASPFVAQTKDALADLILERVAACL